MVIVLLLASAGTGVRPATAHRQECAGSGVLLTPPLRLASFGDSTGQWTLSLSTTTCAPTGALTASGTMTGKCNRASGIGTANGHAFTLTWVNGEMTWSFDALGYWHATPDATTIPPQSCLTGAARWLVEGATDMS